MEMSSTPIISIDIEPLSSLCGLYALRRFLFSHAGSAKTLAVVVLTGSDLSLCFRDSLITVGGLAGRNMGRDGKTGMAYISQCHELRPGEL